MSIQAAAQGKPPKPSASRAPDYSPPALSSALTSGRVTLQIESLVLSAFLSLAIGATSALGHEQAAVGGGKRIQPTQRSFEQRLKEHKALREKLPEKPPATNR